MKSHKNTEKSRAPPIGARLNGFVKSNKHFKACKQFCRR